MRQRDEGAAPAPGPGSHGMHYQRGSEDHGGYHRQGSRDERSPYPVEEEGVEVVLDSTATKVMDDSPARNSRGAPGQNVFRQPPSSHAVRPRAVRPPGGHSLGGSGSGSGSFSRGGEYHPAPTAVPYNPSGSFDQEGYSHPHPQQQHYSPHVQYPHGGRYPSEDVNVISPSHGKGESGYSRPPRQSRHAPPPQQGYYQYPPTSPVSRPGGSSSTPRKSNSHRTPEGPYSAAQRGHTAYHPDDGTWNQFPPAAVSGEQRSQPGNLIAESSFDSEHYASSHHSQYSSQPPSTPGDHPHSSMPPSGPPPAPASAPVDPAQQFYGGGGSWGSFDSAGPPPQFDDQRYYGYPPTSPYPPYDASYYADQPYAPPSYAPPPYEQTPPARSSYDEDEQRMLRDYHPDRDGQGVAAVTPNDSKRHGSSPPTDSTPVASNTSSTGMLLPQAAYEVEFEVTSPPMEPVTQPSIHPVCSSPAEVNEDDVLCGRGGGTNSQIGNRRFRKLVQDFQPTYLLARRKEKPLIARTIVLIIRTRGGRFLKKNDDTGELYEVGDQKAEAKTSQALREGLDVRATKSAANSLLDKKKKKKSKPKEEKPATPVKKQQAPPVPVEPKSEEPKECAPEPEETKSIITPTATSPAKSDKSAPSAETKEDDRAKTPPPELPALKGEEAMSGLVHPHSPENLKFRKRRRMRSGESIPFQDKLFPEFCPPRADLCRASSPSSEPIHGNMSSTSPNRKDEDVPQPGCAGIAMEMVLGAASGGFCLGPKWRRPSSR